MRGTVLTVPAYKPVSMLRFINLLGDTRMVDVLFMHVRFDVLTAVG
jgi:hypothetical protein